MTEQSRAQAHPASQITLTRAQYETELARLQTEFVVMQEWIRAQGLRMAVLFEGRDTAGKGGVIKRITYRTNPRFFRVVALGAPSDIERGQWYFQRYVEHLPTSGEITLFDRSWYNRAGVEHVMGFCSNEEYHDFLEAVPTFEHLLIRDGLILVKYWLSVSDAEQRRRFTARIDDPARRWKLSPMDLEAQARWVDYAEAKDRMFAATDTDESPWFVVDAEDKRSARLNLMTHLLDRVPYEQLPEATIKIPPMQKRRYKRPPKDTQRFVPARFVVD